MDEAFGFLATNRGAVGLNGLEPLSTRVASGPPAGVAEGAA